MLGPFRLAHFPRPPMTSRLWSLLLALLAAFLFVPYSVAAEGKAVLEITVEAGNHDRVNVPVCAAFNEPPIQTVLGPFEIDLNTGAVWNGDELVPATQLPVSLLGTAMRGERSCELVFIVPMLEAGKSATFRIDAQSIEPRPPRNNRSFERSFQWIESGVGETDLELASRNINKSVLRYVHPLLDETDAKTRELTYKPFHHVFSPDGKRIVTKGPGGQYTHHRGLYFGFNRITYGDGLKCDVWHCGKPAHQAHEKILAADGGVVSGRHRLQIGWHGAQGEKFAEEQRELTVYNVAGGQFIEFASIVSTADGNPIKLDGDPQHAGFHFRADNEVSEKTKSQTYYLRPDGRGKPGETRNWDAKKREPKAVNEPWKVMSFVLGDTRYSALYLDHPNNPKEARSSERDYGRFGSYFEYEITKDKPLRVNYRLILKEGEFTPEEAARLSADFTDPPKVSVRKL
jgi:hypothetical protein